ncbi:hypothetical protein Agub_g12100 [Astrephomene gubernaculifera]|uniref:alpha-1,2-Mannosidase n=1 Tax=Astrephomene gubernaculifera TaxID=47775 RepID=A0AAD3DZV2_9CHLO|nr:hypothetical protein Agub_g12100 [Astrephomene gubernaculifera]
MWSASAKTGRSASQRLLSTRIVRLCILIVGSLALLTYVWKVTFSFPDILASHGDEQLLRQRRFLTASGSSSGIPVAAQRSLAPSQPTQSPQLVPEPQRPLRQLPYTDQKYRLWNLTDPDTSPRCAASKICDGNYDCGPDGLGCVTDAAGRREFIRKAAKWTWEGYRKYAWGHDELNAVNRSSYDWLHLGLTIVDSLDTLQLLGLEAEYEEARHWVLNNLDSSPQGPVSVFETIIRVLGGLLSAFARSGDQALLGKALEFGDRLLPAFNTTTGAAQPQFELRTRGANESHYRAHMELTCVAEVGTLSLEFSSLSRFTGRPEFRQLGVRSWQLLGGLPSLDGLLCIDLQTTRDSSSSGSTGDSGSSGAGGGGGGGAIDSTRGGSNGTAAVAADGGERLSCRSQHYGFGPAADSAYEYMLKQWILSNGRDGVCLDMYTAALRGMRRHLLREVWAGPELGSQWMVAERQGPREEKFAVTTLMLDHLTCFLPGTLALGHMYRINSAAGPEDDDDLTLAVKLAKTCYEMYRQSASGVAFDAVLLIPDYSSLQSNTGSLNDSQHAVKERWMPGDEVRHPASSPLQPSTVNAFGGGAAAAGSGGGSSGEQRGPQGGVMQGHGATNGVSHRRRLLQQGGQQGQGQQPHEGQQQGGLQQQPQVQQQQPAAGRPRLKHVFQPQRPESKLRPEVVESLFYLWRATGDPIYREWGWNMFRALERWCRVESGGYQGLAFVDKVPPPGADRQESFWLAETLKYFYLLFSDDPDEVPLDEFVFNTEAHPLPIWGSPADTRLRQALRTQPAGGRGAGGGRAPGLHRGQQQQPAS